MNVEQRQAAADPQTKSPDLGCESAIYRLQPLDRLRWTFDSGSCVSLYDVLRWSSYKLVDYCAGNTPAHASRESDISLTVSSLSLLSLRARSAPSCLPTCVAATVLLQTPRLSIVRLRTDLRLAVCGSDAILAH